MAFTSTVHKFFSAIFCMSFIFMPENIHAQDEAFNQNSIREVSRTSYLGKPASMAKSVHESSTVCQNEGFCSRYGGNNNDQPNVASKQGTQTSLPASGVQAQQVDQVQDQQLQEQQPPSASKSSFVPQLQPSLYKRPNCGPTKEGYTINYEDISVVELIKFLSTISGTNFIFNKDDLNFNITIIAEDPTSVTDISAALLQILKMHNLTVLEEGNNVLIYKQPQTMSQVSTVITDDNVDDSCDTAIVTRVFQLYNVQAEKIAAIIKTLVSPGANVEPSIETRHLIVTDITANVNRIADLLSALDTPNLAIDVAEYSVQSANAATLAEYAREILAPLSGGTPLTITPEVASQKVFIVATPFIINKALQILESLDVPEITALNPLPPALAIENNNFFMYKLKYQNGQEIADALHEIGINLQYTGVGNLDFVNTLYSIQWLEVNNSIVITGTDDAIQKVVALMDDLDRLPKQVYIEVLVLDTTLSNSLDFGVQWIALGDEQNKLAFASGLLGVAPGSAPQLEGTNTSNPGARFVASRSSTPGSPLSTSGTSGSPPAVPVAGRDVALPNPAQLNGIVPSNFTEAFGLGIIGNIIRHNGQSFLTLGALLSALDEESDVSIVLNPKVMVEDTQPANFFVGQNIPYQTTSTVIQQTGSVTQNIQYEDIGVQLQVTPTIAPDNMVTLQINQTVATLATAVGILTPTTNKTLATTRVHVPDGTFLVMSGQITDSCTYIRSGIPCLGALPLIGPAFSRNIEQRQKRNLIFFIRPKVITNIDEGIVLTNEEGYGYNWGSNPCSLRECGCEKAPECETYPSPSWPPIHPFCPPPESGKPPAGKASVNRMQSGNASQSGNLPANPNAYPPSQYDYWNVPQNQSYQYEYGPYDSAPENQLPQYEYGPYEAAPGYSSTQYDHHVPYNYPAPEYYYSP